MKFTTRLLSRRRLTDGRSAEQMLESLENRVMLNGDSFPSLSLLEDANNPVVRMQTERGDIFIELLANEAPSIVEDFLEKLDDNATNQTFFHNLVPGVSLRGGSWFFLRDADGDNFYGPDALSRPGTSFGLVQNNRPHAVGTIAAHLYDGGAMVFNLADNTAAHANDYAVFARVLDPDSWAVVEDIASLPTASIEGAPNIHAAVQGHLGNVPVDSAYTPGTAVSPNIVVQSPDMMLIKQQGGADYYRHTLYSAEGFTGSTISEFIPISNVNAQEVFYEVRVRYERAPGDAGISRDDLVFRGSLAANVRGGVTISTPDNWDAATVLPNRPYAIEIWSTLPVSANFSHYDFGVATGEAFVSTLNTYWFVGEVEKSNDGHDFILWYNPNPNTVTVELTFRADGVNTLVPIQFQIEPMRRGGINIRDHANIPNGLYSVTVEATSPVLVSMSHYGNVSPIDGWGAVGQAGAPALFSIVPIAYEAGAGAAAAPQIAFAFHNPGLSGGVVSIDFYESGSNVPVHSLNNVVTLAPNARGRITIDAATLPQVPSLTAVVRSTQPVYTATKFVRVEDSYAAGVAVSAGTNFHFAEGFTDPSRTAPNQLEESLTIFNPYGAAFDLAQTQANVTFTFRYTDGASFTINRTVEGGSGLNLRVSSLQEVIDQANIHGRYFYSIEVSSSLPIVAQFMHTDRSLGSEQNAGGGFSTLGTSYGTLTRIDNL